ncbi:lambda family phage portal protein [Methylopila capsulata]|uniref:Phage portal protein n=1 Tax=Methylopila capsulata TaxID=61654 RepID=A0A9W6MQT2_9HYPH|nr:phage portal protein [Methylopila capsulata]MBM7851286.1 lambda family phage portal protein [Methylopila capsulata]GLK54344.1 phage portal protein [Methylopila capsulata]
MLARARAFVAELIRPAASERTRRFDGAAGGRRLGGVGTMGPINPEVGAAAHMVRARARYLTRNNQWLANAVANWTTSLVGSGIRPTSARPEALAAFDTWALDADADGRTDFWGLQSVIARALVEDGESFVLLRAEDEGFRALVIPAEQVDESATRDLDGGGYLVQGVEFDASGARVAYHVLPHRPTQMFASYAPPVRIDAADVLHVMAPIAPGQVRGVSWLAPIILPANELDQLTDALLVSTKIAAMHAGFLVDQNGAGEPFDGDPNDISLEPGVVRRLPAGFDIKFSGPQQVQQTAEFVKHSLRGLAAGLGLPTHMLDGDLSGANYSSLRAGLIPFRARVEQIQYGCFTPQLLRPLWARVQLLTGVPDAVAEWLPPAWAQVDPQKAIEADVAEINAGLASRRQKVAARGWPVEELDAEIAADREREAGLGLTFGSAAAEPNEPQPEKEPE